jgi:hypothetical protein
MAAKNERAQIELFAAAAPEGPDPTVSARFDKATLAPSPPDWPPDGPRGVRAATPTPKDEGSS